MQGMEHMICPYGTGCQTTSNSEHLLLFCNTNGLCIGNPFFVHKHNTQEDLVYSTPNWLISNKIDYICISSHGRSVLQDMRVYRGADFGSDHHLLKAVLRLRLKIKQAPNPKIPFDLNKLKNDAVNHQYQQ